MEDQGKPNADQKGKQVDQLKAEEVERRIAPTISSLVPDGDNDYVKPPRRH